MLRKFIRNIRQKPKAVRNNIALTTAAVFTAMIFSVWLYHFPTRVGSLETFSNANKDDTPSFSNFFSNMQDQLASIGDAQKVATEEMESGGVGNNAATNTWSWRKTPSSATTTDYSTATSGEAYFGTEGIEMASATTSSATTTSLNQHTFATTSTPSEPSRPIRIVTTSTASTSATTTSGQ